ncbi:MAG TPA: hypothetical protein VNS32_12185, partial [Flavisolibacter sp.]|nr:hypothetical protein [Flavisolibacter sp.]
MSNESKTEGLISLSEFHEFLFRTIVPIRDLVDYKGEPIEKILPFWRKSELTPFLPKGKWAGISFADLIWLRILDTLRQFSYPIEKTKKVCDYFFKDAYDHDLPKKNLEYTRDLLAKKKVAGTISEEEVVVLDEIEQDLNDKELLYVLKFKVNYLTNLIIDCLNSGEEKGILIFYDGRVGEHSGQHYYSHAKRIVDPTLPHIYLSITHFLKEFIEDEQLSELVIPQLLNEEEHKV